MKKILVIGKNGNLGSELVRQLQRETVTLVAWDKEELNITNAADGAKKIGALQPDVVFNCAAYNNVDAAEVDSSLATSINGDAPGFIAQACADAGAIFVHYSSDYVFNGESPAGYSETSQPQPINAYGQSKLLGEQAIQKNTDKFYIIRTSWLFGTKGSSPASKPSFVDTMLALAKTKPELKLVSDEQSRPTYIADLAVASIALAESGRSYGIYHIVNEGTASWYELAREAFSRKGLAVVTHPVSSSEFPRAAQRPRYGFLNNTKLPALRTWQEALAEYLQESSL